MARLPLVIAAAVALSFGCSANTATQEPAREPAQTHAAPAPPEAVLVRENPVDRSIRHDLQLAIAGDDGLKDRDIRFFVTNGDVSVTGTVRTEDERKRINDLAMNIGGVKSVANALRVGE